MNKISKINNTTQKSETFSLEKKKKTYQRMNLYLGIANFFETWNIQSRNKKQKRKKNLFTWRKVKGQKTEDKREKRRKL